MSATGNDYAELCDLGPMRWSSRGYYHIPTPAVHSSHLHPNILQPNPIQTSSSSVPTGGSTGLTVHPARPPTHNSNEAEDIVASGYGMTTPPPPPSGATGLINSYALNSRISNSNSSLRGGRSGLYYSPPGTSYTIIERPHSPHYYYNSAGIPNKGGSLPGRGSTYLAPSSPANHMSGNMSGSALPTSSSARYTMPSASVASYGNKKRPISPEQVLRMFGAPPQSSSASVPTSSYHYSNGTRDRTGHRSPASSPPSATHQVGHRYTNAS